MFSLLAAAALQAAGNGALVARPPLAQAAEQSSESKTRRFAAAELFDFAARAAAMGDVGVAERALVALLSNPDVRNRSEARFRLAQLRSAQGRPNEAAVLLRQIVDEQPREARPRLELAGLQVRLGDEEGARRTLRAANAGPLPPAIARLVERWSDTLRSRKPVGLSIELSIAPDSNINRSTRSDTLGTVLGDFTIDPEGQAKSGIGLSMRALAYRRRALSSNMSLLARLNTSVNLYRAKDFNQLAAEVAVGPEFSLTGTRIAVEAGAGQSWFGGKHFTRHFRLTASVRKSVSARTAAGIRASMSAIDNRLNPLQDGRATTVDLSLEHAISNANGIALSTSAERFSARDPGYATKSGQIGVTAWQDIGRTTIFAGAEYGLLRGDEPLLLFPEARRDRSLRLHLGTTMRGLTVLGLAPFVRVTRERNRSNIAFHDYARTRTEIGVSRAF